MAEGAHVAEVVHSYVKKHGSFSLHEKGLIGLVAPGHRNLMADLDQLLGHVAQLADGSAVALQRSAEQYQQTDLRSASSIDATYPGVTPPPLSRD